jgi:chromosomal replication initiation ATPase DnaA
MRRLLTGYAVSYNRRHRRSGHLFQKSLQVDFMPGRSVSAGTGGGLIRSVGGWGVLRSLRRMNFHYKSDERILGDSDFVETVLKDAAEKMERKYRLKAAGYDFNRLVERISDLFKIEKRLLLAPSKRPERVMARSVLSYWAVRELGMPGTAVGERLGLSQSAVSRAVQRGERLISEGHLSLRDEINA